MKTFHVVSDHGSEQYFRTLAPVTMGRARELVAEALANGQHAYIIANNWPKLRAIEVNGRRWFQRSYGNTYNTFRARVQFDDGTEKTIIGAKAYGYGSAFEDRARDALADAGIVPPSVTLSIYARENGIFYARSVFDVPRERDL